jgi:hypothetical protein
VQRYAPAKVLDLHPAREPRRNHHVSRPSRSQIREQLLFPDQARDLIVLFLITKRAGHAAATRIEIDDLRAWNAPRPNKSKTVTAGGL